jgi:hypothetical protein
MKSSIFWDITSCSPLEVNRHFGGIHRHHLQGRRISRAKNQPESRWKAEPEDENGMFLRNVGRISTDYTALYPSLFDELISLQSIYLH